MAIPGIAFPTGTRFTFTIVLIVLLGCVPNALAADVAYVRVNQAGYEPGGSHRAYLMSTAPETGATFQVINSKGSVLFSGNLGQLLGTWSHSKTLAYSVYALDFTVPAGNICEIKVSGPVPAVSPKFAVDRQKTLYSGLLLNTLFFYETERDGKNFVRNALRTGPGHLKDVHARFYVTPPLDSNDFIKNVPPKDPLIRAKLPIADVRAAGGMQATMRNMSKPRPIPSR